MKVKDLDVLKFDAVFTELEWSISWSNSDLGLKWILYDNRKQLIQWLDLDEAHKHFSKSKLHEQKITLTCELPLVLFFDSFLESDQNPTAKVNWLQLDEIYVPITKIWPSLVNWWDPILLHHNAHPHIIRMTQKFSDSGYETLSLLPYFPDLSHIDYRIFKYLGTFFRTKNIPFQRSRIWSKRFLGAKKFLTYKHK